MKIKVSDYIADFFADNGIKTIFTVVGGGAMHMNHSFGHHARLHCVYNHHEQASSIAAEAHFRVNNEMAGLCVTSGPGAINALNGVVGAYQDSIPMIVVSGQCKSTLTVRNSGLNLRTLGNQEFDIVSALDNACKYSEMILNPKDIRYCLEKAFYIARSGRPGPCWLDIPLDIQGAYIDDGDLKGFIGSSEYEEIINQSKSQESDIKQLIPEIIERLLEAKRPVIYAGNGIRIAGAVSELLELAEKTQIPIVTCWDSIDIINTDNPLYVGRGGIMGDRAGNFAVQNSDLLIAIGSRLNIYQVGYQLESWARESYVVCVDIDSEELKKPTVRIDMPVCCDAKKFIDTFNGVYKDGTNGKDRKQWLNQCVKWKEKYPVVQTRQYDQVKPVNVYAFIDKLSRSLKDGSITVVANGSASVVGSAAYYIGKGSRFIMNCGLSSMGYDLPAAIGASVANGNKEIICIAGDGSIQMNIQELQTIVTNKLPVKIIVINNEGYQQIRITQTNLFNKEFVGLGPESGDLGFPDFGKLSYAYGIPYYGCEDIDELDEILLNFLNEDGFAMLEVKCSTDQFFEPKSATKRLPDGTLFSPPLEDLAPFLPVDELRENMYIPLVEKK